MEFRSVRIQAWWGPDDMGEKEFDDIQVSTAFTYEENAWFITDSNPKWEADEKSDKPELIPLSSKP
jgi:hypothetical protein